MNEFRPYPIRHTRPRPLHKRLWLRVLNLCLRVDYRRRLIWRRVLVACGVPCCEGFQGPCCNVGERRQMNTAYVVHEKNFCFMCEDCFNAVEAYRAERWGEYYSQVM